MLYLLWGLLFVLLMADFGLLTYIFYTKVLEPGAVYYQTTDKSVDKMLELAKVTSGDVVVDLGSGDGKIVIEAAKLGATAIGYEINPLLVLLSRRKINAVGLKNRATIYWKSFWKADFTNVSVVMVYLFPHLMGRLWQLLNKKIKPPIRIVANDYPFPAVNPSKIVNKIYLYKL